MKLIKTEGYVVLEVVLSFNIFIYYKFYFWKGKEEFGLILIFVKLNGE